jgi:NAD(P)-dependent dehydrogenase (short-subunit alcohol dehydrogenase family)
VALVTGARVKIGYATALRLLRAGARVIATTRFPHDAARRYSNELDFAEWRDRLQIYGLDFRYLPVLERFVGRLRAGYPALDILINNAAQTVRRPPDYYAHLLPFEQMPLSALTPAQQELVQQSHALLPPTPFAIPDPLLAEKRAIEMPSATLLHEYGLAAVMPQDHDHSHFPVGEYDEHLHQIDLRQRNSWTLPFNEIGLTEFLEVQVINVTAPFLLVSRLYPLLKSSSFSARFIVNVSAIEGQFAGTKLGNHVHTNMAKASLNMLTHTAADELARDHIFMNSVDPGWISQQGPFTDEQNREKIQQLLPLDLIDAAARICDPIFMGVVGEETRSGYFYKDYQPVSW